MGGRTWPLRLKVASLRIGRVLGGGGEEGRVAERARRRESFPVTIDTSNKRQYRVAFCAPKHTRSSYKPAIFMDSGLSFDASSEVYGGEDLALAVGSGKLKGRSGSVLGEGVKRAGQQRERDGGNSFLATTDSIRQQHRTALCALKHTRSSYKPAIYYQVQRVGVR